jgi:predicted RNase H-like HicB family nuclease
MLSYTACYTKTESGYTGQLLEWPEVITEGGTIEDCREMLEDAAREMIEVYKEDKIDIPQGHIFFEHLPILENVGS